MVNDLIWADDRIRTATREENPDTGYPNIDRELTAFAVSSRAREAELLRGAAKPRPEPESKPKPDGPVRIPAIPPRSGR